ncbi:MAG TPA: riboflavin biosynthesis protein RibF, partial [Victivallales bacterium]|nr:riboflavin biosynthesis protein RibF [Victivallales bacterium]
IGIGVFDGVHIGHRHLIGELTSEARRNASLPVIMTFYPHPRMLIGNNQKISLLLPHHQKLKILAGLGIRAVVTLAFTEDFALLSARDFLEKYMLPQLICVKAIFVGKNWRFGAGGEGNTAMLANFAKLHKMKLFALEEYKIDGEKVSSSNIRRAIANGDLATAAKMLGSCYTLWGKVKKGLAFAGKHLGFPTANIDPGESIIPPEGVYCGQAIINGIEYPAAISIGTAQSVRRDNKNRDLLIEAHIIGFNGELYGSEIELRFISYIREQRYFNDISKLKEQIAVDVEYVKKKLNK